VGKRVLEAKPLRAGWVGRKTILEEVSNLHHCLEEG
jgi:hypothetical protein